MFSSTTLSSELKKKLYSERPKSIDTFMNAPYVTVAKKGNIAVLGVPYDSSVTGRDGARFGPKIIRAYSRYLLSELNKEKINLSSLVDLGDIPVILGYPSESLLLIYEGIKNVLNADAFPVVLGGDHLITYSELKAHREKFGKMAILHFDAHHDTSNTGIQFSHGAVFRNAIENNLIDTNHSVQIGMRGFNVTYRRKFAEACGIDVYEAHELHHADLSKICSMITEKIGRTPTLVTIDIDFFDASFVPGTGTPVANGFSVRKGVFLISNILPHLNVKGMDLVETAPQKDNTQSISTVANRIILECLSAINTKNEHIN